MENAALNLVGLVLAVGVSLLSLGLLVYMVFLVIASAIVLMRMIYMRIVGRPVSEAYLTLPRFRSLRKHRGVGQVGLAEPEAAKNPYRPPGWT